LSNIDPSFYYTNYGTVAKHLNEFKDVVTSIGKVIEAEFDLKLKKLIKNNPQVIRIIPLFTAVRPDRMIVLEKGKAPKKKFDENSISLKEAFKFLREVGFYEIFNTLNKIDIASYYLGIEVGLDSNGRKNRSGKQMEYLVASYLKGQDIDFIGQANIENMSKQNLFKDLIITSNAIKKKRFDFIIRTKNTIYFTEVNFFNASGSKIDINSRFVSLQDEIKNYSCNKKINREFLLITDGQGLKKAKNELQNVHNEIKYIMNIDDLDHYSLKELL
jgi:type II restriction enzyme